jgi:L-ascorbate metabolism protein UlaG (beta-lactamase superfamily)
MSNPAQARLIFHKNSFFELATPSRTLFIDPVFSHERRGRRVADEVRTCDYVLATSMTPWFEDVLDVLDACDATFVGSHRLTRFVSSELGLKKSRLLDLEPWERASEAGLRITALPISASIGMENAIEEGTSIVRDISNIFPRGATRIPLLGAALPLFDNGMRNATRLLQGVTSIGQPRAFGRVGDMLGVDVGQITGGRPGLGFLFELDGFPSLMHLADGVHAATSDDDLDDIADVAEPDVLVMHVSGMDVEPVVRAVRTLRPKTVLLYRSRDPYAAGRRGQTLPISSFIGAIEEGAPGTEALHMRKGDAYILAAIAPEKASSAAARTPQASSPFASPKPSAAAPPPATPKP